MTSPALPGIAEVLLVEDDPGDVLLTSEAFAQHHLDVQLHVVGDGDEATRFLRRTGDFASAPRPALVLLDLNLPRRSGLEALADLKADPDLQTIPVVVLTTSPAQQDIPAQLPAAHQRLRRQTDRRRPVQRRDRADR
jgi:two-component system response regulator